MGCKVRVQKTFSVTAKLISRHSEFSLKLIKKEKVLFPRCFYSLNSFVQGCIPCQWELNEVRVMLQSTPQKLCLFSSEKPL